MWHVCHRLPTPVLYRSKYVGISKSKVTIALSSRRIIRMNKNSSEDNEDNPKYSISECRRSCSPITCGGFRAQNLIRAEQMCEMKKVRFRWEVLDHPPYSPDLAPIYFHLFEPLKKHLGCQHFKTDAEVQHAGFTWWHNISADFHAGF
ncbi:hypothetical protein TNCV_4514081 [Trichonephila clavipes]|nr:hypothetical protein TNCV_4514081 [Trichonephila clavipes]